MNVTAPSIKRAPYIKHPDNVRNIMADVIIALLPVVLWGVYAFGARALSIIAVSVLASVLTETIITFVTKKYITVLDLSAVVTGLLLALALPVTVPLYIPAVGAVFAVGVVKCTFGGLGGNFVNPALAGYVFLKLAFPEKLALSAVPFTDAVTGATPLVSLKEGLLPETSLYDMLVGNSAGSIGEISTVLILIGGIYLLVRGIIGWQIPIAVIGSVAALTVFFSQNASGMMFVLAELTSGGLFLVAFFMATDPVTSPMRPFGKLIYGALIGAVTVLLRYYGSAPEGVAYAVLLANLFVGVIDKITTPARFGGSRRDAHAAADVSKDTSEETEVSE